MPNPLRALAMALILSGVLKAEAQSRFIYRGSLQEGGRSAAGVYDFRFALANGEHGNFVSGFLTNHAVHVKDGIFAVTLDFGLEVFNGTPRWLEIGVRRDGGNAEFTVLRPRQELMGIPHAIHAQSASRAEELEGGGAFLWNVPASSLTGRVPVERLAGITSQQLDPLTDSAYRSVDTNAVKALIQTSSGQGRTTPFDFGAVGDGKADDTAALQAWLDAAQERNFIAELPPAPAYYRISDALQLRRAGGLTLIGAGGQSHITGGPPYTRCRIHQVTPGKHALVITNIAGSATPTDNVYLQGFMVTAEEYSPRTYGIAFMGGIADTDVNVIMNIGVRNFGVGLFNASACNLSAISCSFSYCGDGIQLNGPVVNSVMIQSTICTGNRSNGLHVISAKNVTFDTGDLVTWRTDNAHLATIRSGLVSIRNLNGEHGSSLEAIKILCTRPDAHVTFESGMILPFNNPSENSYSLSVSNAGSVFINGTLLYARAADGFAIIEHQSPPAVSSLRPYPEKVVVRGMTATNWLGNHLRTFLPEFDKYSVNATPIIGSMTHAGLLSVINTPGDTELLFSADLSQYNQLNRPVQVPLLQYAKDRLSTMTVSNLAVTGGISNPAWLSGTYASYPGLITRVVYKDGGISGVGYEEWDADAQSYVERTGLSGNALETAAVDQLVKRLKVEKLWYLADAIYLFRGGTAQSCALNLVSTNYPISWFATGPETFGREGVTGNGSAFGLSSLELSSAGHFAAGSGSLFVYVGHTGASPSIVAGARAGNGSAYLGTSSGLFGIRSGVGMTNALSEKGPVVLSMTSSTQGFLAGRGFTDSFSSTATSSPATQLGILAAAGASGEPVGQSSANLRAVWVGGGLSTTQARTLIACMEEYLKMIGLAVP